MTDTDQTRRSLTGPVFPTLMGLAVIAALAMLPIWAGPPPEEGLPDLAKFFGRVHPVMLHLPIGMLLLGLALETGRLFSKKPSSSTQVAMFFAAVSAVVATLLGFVLYYSMSGEYEKELAERHLNGGIIFACGTVAAFIVKSMPVTTLRWLVVAVVLYAAVVMLRAAVIGRREPLSPLEERAEAI